MNSEIYKKMPLNKLFFRCAVPAAVTSVFGALYSVIDGMFVGRYLGADALAAINLIMPIIMIVEAISNMIATGASVNMSILLGEGKRVEASKVFSFSVKFILLFSVAVGILGFFLAKPFIILLAPGANTGAVELSVKYLKVFAVFSPVVPIYFATDNYLRVCGKPRLSMTINIVSQVSNVILDFLFIVVLRQGVIAAAAASCISIAIGSVWSLLLFPRKRMDVYFTKGNLSASQFLHIIANGSSELFSSTATSVMSIVMNLFLLKYGGTTAVAAFSIIMYVDSILGMLNLGICDSLRPAISHCYGAGLLSRMRSILKYVITATVIVAVIAFLFMLFAGPYVATIFIKPGDNELTEMSITAIRIFSFSYLAGWIDMCFSSWFTALDKPMRSLLISLFGTVVFPGICLFILPRIWGLNGVWLTASVAAFASGILTFFLFKTMKIEK